MKIRYYDDYLSIFCFISRDCRITKYCISFLLFSAIDWLLSQKRSLLFIKYPFWSSALFLNDGDVFRNVNKANSNIKNWNRFGKISIIGRNYWLKKQWKLPVKKSLSFCVNFYEKTDNSCKHLETKKALGICSR